MAFWGVEVKPGKPYTHPSENPCGRLRVSQATLGIGSFNKKSLVQCNVGKKSPVLLCSLLPDKTEYCHLDLEFDEAEEVVFSVIGPRSVHLTGYFLGSSRRHGGINESSESFGEDIGDADSEKSNDCSEDKYDDSFINDDDDDVFASSPGLSSEGTDEEVIDIKKPKEKKHKHRRLRKKLYLSDSEDNETVALGNIDNGHAPEPLAKSKDEDQLPISSLVKSENAVEQDKLEGRKVKDIDKSNGTNNFDAGDGDLKRLVDLPDNTLEATFEVEDLIVDKKKRKRSMTGSSEAKAPKSDFTGQNNINEAKVQLHEAKSENTKDDPSSKTKHLQHQVIERTKDNYIGISSDEAQSGEKKGKRKKRKKQVVVSEKAETMNSCTKGTDSFTKLCENKVLSNGLVIEELKVGKSDGKVASSGSKVKIHYTAMLKKGYHVYDKSSCGNPLTFRLGKGRAIDGLEAGIDGMRVGGRRRITIPPELGYGNEGIAGSVPPNSWVVMDVELLRVR